MQEPVGSSPIEFTATTAFLVNALEVTLTGTTASHRDEPEILYTIATAQAHSESVITLTSMTDRHRSGMAILRILVTAPDVIGSSIRCTATERNPQFPTVRRTQGCWGRLLVLGVAARRDQFALIGQGDQVTEGAGPIE
jgi:hypothetical protein